MPKPLFGNQILDDTFEQLTDQAKDAGRGLQDAVAGQQDQNSDSGIEQLAGGSQDPRQQLAQAQKQGLTPQQMAEKQAEQKKAMDYHRNYIQQVDQEQANLRQEAEMKKKQAAEEQQARKDQEIVELREEEAKAVTLHPQKASMPKGPGSAFMQQSTKSQTEFSKTATQ